MLKLRGQVSSPFKPSFFFFLNQVFHHRPQLWSLLCKGGIKQALSILLEYAEFLYILWQCQFVCFAYFCCTGSHAATTLNSSNSTH